MAATVRCFVDGCTYNQNSVCVSRYIAITSDGMCEECHHTVKNTTEDSFETLAEYKVRCLREEGLL